MIDINFPYEKVIQALNYLANHFDGTINKMKAIKLIYFSDRFHYRKYGELFTKDKYLAMDYGPVPSRTKDLTISNIYLSDDVLQLIDEYLDTSEKYELKSKKDVNSDYLSETEIEALSFALDKFGDKNQYQLAEISHFYPEWLALKERLKTEKSIPMDLDYFIEDPEKTQEPCYELSEESREDLKEELKEKEYAYNILS